jgi:S1-C subfamily serine protease
MRAAHTAAAFSAALMLAACSAPATDLKTASADVRFEVVKQLKDGPQAGVGSGVYIGNGIIITAAHNLTDAVSFKIRSDAGDIQSGEVLWVNTDYDIAAVRPANAGRFKAAQLSCREPLLGEEISAVGNPVGIEFVTMRGYVSGGERAAAPQWKSVFITDLTTIGGMSGGATYSRAGELIGITVGTLGFNAPAGGLGFAVPGSTVCRLLGRA